MTNPTRLNTRAFSERLGLIILLISLVVLSTCRASSYALFHRLGPPPPTTNNETNIIYEWQQRAVLEISSSGSNLENYTFVVSSLTKNNHPLKIPSLIPLESLDYQVTLLPQNSLDPSGLVPDSASAINSYPLCAILSDRSPKNEYLNIWIKPSVINEERSHPSSTDDNHALILLGIQWSYSDSSDSSSSLLYAPRSSFTCDYPQKQSAGLLDSFIKSQLIEFINNLNSSPIKVSVRTPEKLIDPILKAYPTHKTPEYLPDGRVKEAGPEKGFLAKYWMYILPVVILLVMGGGAPPEEENNAPDQSHPTT